MKFKILVVGLLISSVGSSQAILDGKFGLEKMYGVNGGLYTCMKDGKGPRVAEYLPVENGDLIRRCNFTIQRFSPDFKLIWETDIAPYAKAYKMPKFFMSANADYVYSFEDAAKGTVINKVLTINQIDSKGVLKTKTLDSPVKNHFTCGAYSSKAGFVFLAADDNYEFLFQDINEKFHVGTFSAEDLTLTVEILDFPVREIEKKARYSSNGMYPRRSRNWGIMDNGIVHDQGHLFSKSYVHEVNKKTKKRPVLITVGTLKADGKSIDEKILEDAESKLTKEVLVRSNTYNDEILIIKRNFDKKTKLHKLLLARLSSDGVSLKEASIDLNEIESKIKGKTKLRVNFVVAFSALYDPINDGYVLTYNSHFPYITGPIFIIHLNKDLELVKIAGSKNPANQGPWTTYKRSLYSEQFGLLRELQVIYENKGIEYKPNALDEMYKVHDNDTYKDVLYTVVNFKAHQLLIVDNVATQKTTVYKVGK